MKKFCDSAFEMEPMIEGAASIFDKELFFGTTKRRKKREALEELSLLICSFNFDDGLLHNREADDVDEPAQEGGEAAAEEGRRIGRCQCVYAVGN